MTTAKASFKSVGVVFPGEPIECKAGARFGDGIVAVGGTPTVSKAGMLKHQERTNYYYVLSDSKRYHPAVDDVCVGVVRSKGKDKYYVDIGAYRDAELDNLAFENAKKRSRPLLEDGDAVYCRVSELAERPHVVCVSKRNMEDGYGPLVGGWVFDVPQLTARRLMADGCSVLATIGQYTPFEVAVGVNGRVWVRSPNPGRDVVVENCIVACIGVADANVAGTVKLVWESWQKVVD